MQSEGPFHGGINRMIAHSNLNVIKELLSWKDTHNLSLLVVIRQKARVDKPKAGLNTTCDVKSGSKFLCLGNKDR